MSEQSGRGYLPPTAPTAGSHLRPWASVLQQPSFYANQNWHSQIKPYNSSPQAEGIDLSSRPEPAHNGEPVNGQIKEAGVSVIASNPLVQPEEIKEDTVKPFERLMPANYISDNKMPVYPLECKGHPAHPPNQGLEVGVPSPVESKDIPAESKGTPSHPVESKVPLQEKSEPQRSPPSETKEPSQAPSDHVESLLENMFQGEESPVKQSVIVTNSSKSAPLTEDKVVAILEENETTQSPVKAPPDKAATESIMDESEIKKEQSEPDPKSQFMEVESELEKMFAGIVESGDESKPQPKVEVKKRRKPRPRKSTDSIDKKDKRKKLKKTDETKDARLKGSKRVKIAKEGSNDSMAVLSRSRGPYIHFDGTKESPTFVTVINKDEEEKEKGADKVAARRKQHSYAEGRVRSSGMHISTLSSKYNAHNADLSWVCVFCKLRSNCTNGLGGEPAGDLFGPYYLTIPKTEEFDRKTPSDKEVAAEQKKKGGGKQQSLRAIGAADQFIKDFTKKNKKNSLNSEDLSGEREIWVHEMCAVWAPGVLLVGPHLVGLGDAIASASNTKCNKCGQYGACIGCVARNCYARSHYGCALASKWDLDFETFIAACPMHAQKKLKLLGVRST